jgi:hypothetical protein
VPRPRPIAIIGLLMLVTTCVYWRAGDAGFVNLDDDAYVEHQPLVNQGLRSAAIAWAFTGSHSSNWHPLTTLSHMLDCEIFGLRAAPMHWENVLWHALNSALVFLVWRTFTGATWRPAILAALFALHPLHVESVAWISERKDLLVLQVVFQGALVSAILSTVDSALLVAGSLVAHNLVLPLRPALDEASKLRVNRIAVLVFGLIAYGLALSADGVYALVEAASAFGSAGVFTCTLFGLYSKLGGERSALASLAVGVLAYGLGEHVLELGHPFLISVFSSVLAYLAFAPIDGAKHGQPQPSATP